MNNCKTFLYFAYGSNLLAKRIHIQNPSAVRKDIGELKGHKLDFFGFSNRWGGASATIVPHPGHSVWGAIWEINIENLPDLDNQEGVSGNIYFPKIVQVEIPNGEQLECRVYQRAVDPALIENHSILPNDKPSLLYHEAIIQGAIESNLPAHYIVTLRNIQNNGCYGDPEMRKMLDII